MKRTIGQLWNLARGRAAWCAPMLAVCVLAALVGLGAAPARTPSGPAWPDSLVLGLVPSEGGGDIKERYRALAEHLEHSLGVKVEMMTASDYAGVITAMSHKHVDVAYLGPKAYVEAADRANAVAVAMELGTDGTPGYRGLIVARQSGGPATLEEAKGKSFAFTDPNSTSGYLVPLMHFVRDLKTDPKKYFSEVKFAGSHAAALLAVKNGAVEAGATNDLDFARVVALGQVKADEFRILWKSEVIPGAPIAVRRDLPESLKSAIIGALMTMSDDPKRLEHMGNGGYVYANDGAFDVMRYLIRMQQESAPAK